MKTNNNFDAVNFWENDLSPFQRAVKQVLDKEDTKIVHLLTSPQVGKSHFAYRDLFLRIFSGWDKANEQDRNKNKLYAIVFPLAGMLNSFLKEQIPKGFNKDAQGESFTDFKNINIRIPICIGVDKKGNYIYKLKSIIKNVDYSSEISITFFNGCRLICFHSANAEQHINGYPFNHIVFDEYSKHYKNIIHIASPRLLQTNGKLLTVTTLNEDNPANWYYYEIVKDYQDKGKLVSDDRSIFCGLEIYKKSVNDVIEINNGKNIFYKEELKSSNYLLIGRFKKISPYIHNSRNVILAYEGYLRNGDITAQQDKTLYQCDATLDEDRFLSNYNPSINDFYIEENNPYPLLSKIVIGYDHGSGLTDEHSGIGWSLVGVIWDNNNPFFEQFIILDSGLFSGEQASLEYIVNFFNKYPYWIMCDNSLFWNRGYNKTLVESFFYEFKSLKKRMLPSTLNNLRNSSQQRIAFWQKALQVSLPFEKARLRALKRNEVFNLENYIEYKNPFNPKVNGAQIYIAKSRENPTLNERLVWEMLNYKKKIDNGKIKEYAKAKTDVWDAASYAILGLQQWKSKIKNRPDPAKKVENSNKKYTIDIYEIPDKLGRKISLQNIYINNNFSSF